ncbi:MAG: bacterial Ig-like domain-containing protein [Clostridia bacterium]|nr:bacterial Ig-like domain-containing protein [Clostridia bacterium]
MKKRIISILLCAAIVLAMVNLPAAVTYGENEEWHEIYTVEDLYAINFDMSANYILMNDIDLSEDTAEGGGWDYLGNGWNPIGSNNSYGSIEFSGIFDGNGHSIIGMQIRTVNKPAKTSSPSYFGLFAYVSGTVRNLNISGSIDYDNTNLPRGNDSIFSKIGSIAGECSGTLYNCSSSCCFSLKNIAWWSRKIYAGGIVGALTGTASNIYYSGDITLDLGGRPEKTNETSIGGIAGRGGDSYGQGTIQRSFFNGSILDYSSAVALSGIIGTNGIAEECYSVGLLKRDKEGTLGNAIHESYSCNSCYFLSGTGNQTEGALPLSQSQMMLQSMYNGFDFENTWIIYPDSYYKYPQLRSNPIDTENSVDHIEVTTIPSKLEYLEGKDSLIISGGRITIYNKDGTTESKTLTRDMISGFDNTVVGPQVLTVTYGRNTTTYTVTIRPKSVSGISVSQLPSKSQYVELRDNLNVSGGQLSIHYDNGLTEVVPLSDATVTGFNNSLVGENVLTVSYGGFETTFVVEIIPKSVTQIRMHTMPDKLEYIVGKEQLDVSGGKLLVYYDNGTQEIVDLTPDMVSGFSNQAVGKKRLNVTFGSSNTFFDVEITPKIPIVIDIYTLPSKLDYLEGYDELSVAGGQIEISYNDDSYEIIDLSSDMISGFNNTHVGLNTLNVEYCGCSTQFVVTVVPKSATSIAVSHMPDKTEYVEGKDSFDASGCKILVTFNNGTQEEISVTEGMVSGYYNSAAGPVEITVTYESFTASFEIQIVHDYVGHVVLPTIDEGGYTEYVCAGCGDKYVVDHVPALPHYEIDRAKGYAGTVVDVYVSVKNNPGIVSTRFKVVFNEDIFELVGVSDLELLSGYTTPSPEMNSPYTLRWSDPLAAENNTVDGKIVKLSFLVKENTPLGTYEISVESIEARNVVGNQVAFEGTTSEVEIVELILGDADDDGEVTDWDSILFNRYLAYWNDIEININVMDIDGDGEISDWDAIILDRYLANWNIVFGA